MSKPKIAFICVHNSCRSQIAEAFGKVLAADVFESYSAGTETKPQINQDAVRLMKELYGIDMEKTQYSKLISAIPKPDIAISMGCNVSCPFIGRPFDENWGLDDPTGKSDDEFKAVIEQIRQNVLALKSKLCGSAKARAAGLRGEAWQVHGGEGQGTETLYSVPNSGHRLWRGRNQSCAGG